MVAQTKVFVGSLPPGSKPEELRRLFERFGVVTECDVMNRCGFVHMETEDMAASAIRALNNTSFNGGVITVEKGRIKPRGGGGGGGGPGGRGGPRGGGGGMRNGMGGGMRNGIGGGMPRRPGGGGPMRGPPMGGGGGRDAPYMRDRPPMGGGGGGMGMRNGGGNFDRGMDRRYPDDRMGFSGEDRRGFALMDRGGNYGGGNYGGDNMYDDERRGSGGGMYPDERRGGGGGGMYPDDRRGGGGMFDDRSNMMMDRRNGGGGGGGGMRPPMGMGPGSFDRGAPRGNGMGNGDMFSRRSPPMRGGGGGGGFNDRDPYNQNFPPMGRVGGGGGGRGGRDMGMGPRRF